MPSANHPENSPSRNPDLERNLVCSCNALPFPRCKSEDSGASMSGSWTILLCTSDLSNTLPAGPRDSYHVPLRPVPANRPHFVAPLVGGRRRFHCGLSEPGFETRFAESCILVRKQCSLAEFCPSVKRFRISDDFAGIFERGQAPPDKFIDAKLFRASNFDDIVYRRAYCNSSHGARDIVGSHRLEKHMWQTHLVAVRGNVGEAFEELEELRRMHDRVRNR